MTIYLLKSKPLSLCQDFFYKYDKYDSLQKIIWMIKGDFMCIYFMDKIFPYRRMEQSVSQSEIFSDILGVMIFNQWKLLFKIKRNQALWYFVNRGLYTSEFNGYEFYQNVLGKNLISLHGWNFTRVFRRLLKT